jgi:AraC family transcriptional regulator
MRFASEYFHGNTIKKFSTAELKLSETTYASALRLAPHSHDEAYFCFVLEGSFTESYERRSRSCRQSTLVFHPTGETHSDSFETDARCFNIQMNASWFDRVRRHSSIIESSTDFYDEELCNVAMRIYREFRDLDNFSSITIESLTLELIAKSSRRAIRKSEPKPPLWLRRVREILDERFDESLTLVALSESVGVHPVHLAREFRRFYNSTVGEYVRKRRIETACRQISATEFPFSEIAHAAGFFDQSHFTRTLKKFTGMTPSEYRAAYRSRRF